ncbi:MAG: LuxR C-terminal-related transcriptional regulator [Acidithiobacillus sp.]
MSPREAEVLRWAEDGKTAGEIADILQTERTANFHIQKAITKFQVSNKTTAVVQAAMLNLL